LGGQGADPLGDYWSKVDPPQIPPFWEPVVAGITAGIQQVSPLLGIDLLAPIRDGLKSAWDLVRPGVEEVFRLVSGAVGALAYSLWDWFMIYVYPSLQAALTAVKDALLEVLEPLAGWVEGLRHGMVNLYWGLLDWFSWLQGELAKVPEKLGEFAGRVVEQLGKVPGLLLEVLKELWETVKPGLEAALGAIAAGFSAIGEWLYPHLVNLWKLVDQGLRGLWGLLEGWLKDMGRTIGAILAGFWDWLAPKLREAGAWLLEQLEGLVTWMVEVGIPWLRELFQTIIRRVIRPLWDIAQPLIGEVESLVKEVLTWLVEKLKPLAPAAPEKALDTASKVVAYGAILGSGLALTGTILEAPYFTKRLGFAEVFTQIRMQLTPAVIGSFTAGAIVGAVVRTPLEYWINAIFKPKVLDFGMVHEAYGRGKMEDEDYKRYMAWHGIRDEEFRFLKEIAARPVSPFLIRYVAEVEEYQPESIYDMMLDVGYKPEIARLMTNILSLAALSRYRSALLGSAVRLYKEGFKSREWLEEQIRLLGLRPEIIELILAQADYEYLYEYYRDMVEVWKDALRKGQIDEATFRDRLADYIVIPERLDAEVDRALLKLKPTERVLPVEALEDRLERLRMSVSEYEARIELLEVRLKEDLDVRAAQAAPRHC